MPLKAVFVIFMEFDIFRNVGLLHQGLYYLKIRLQSDHYVRIMSCKSNACITSNICDNRPVQDASKYYKPCSVDVQDNSFITRHILIRYQGEEASMRDCCSWRVEIPFDSVSDVSLVFTVDLYTHKPIKNDNRVIAFAEKATFISSQSLSLCQIHTDSDVNYVRLLFPDQGLCEVKGIIQWSLLDVRYQQNTPSDSDSEKSLRFGDYIAKDCDNYLEIQNRYDSISHSIQHQLENSYYHIKNCIQSVLLHYPVVDSKQPGLSDIHPLSIPESEVIEIETAAIHLYSPPPSYGSPRCTGPNSPIPSLESLVCKQFDIDISSPLSTGKQESTLHEVFSFDLQEEEDLHGVGINFANQLSAMIHSYSKRLWSIHDQLVSLLQNSIGEIVEILSKEHEHILHDFYSRFTLVNRFTKQDMTGEKVNVLEEHLAMFDTVLHSQYLENTVGHDIIGNDSLYTFAMNMDGSIQCPLLLVDRYDTKHLYSSLSKQEPTLWICSNPSCHQKHYSTIDRCSKCLTYRSLPNLHVVFLLHGFHAEPKDMRRIADMLLLKYPHLKIIPLQACMDNTSKSLVILASMIAKEMASHLASLPTRTGRSVHRISFLGHSIGSIVIRLALNNPLLQSYQSCYHLFLSLNAPHLGVQFSKKTHEWGKKVLSLVNSSALVDELILKDEKSPKNSLLYRMSQNSYISHFKYFYLFSSCQDCFIPFHCVRSETNPDIQNTTSTGALVYDEMVKGFWKEFMEKECATVVKKFDIYYDNINFSLDSIIGKTAHNNILRDINAIQLLLYQMEECFNS